MDIWHEHLELPELNSKTLVRNKQYSAWTDISKEDISEMKQDGKRWRYTSDPDTWYEFTDLPTVGSNVTVENKDYRVWVLETGALQTRFLNNPAIDEWAYWNDILALKIGAGKNTIMGIKEGSENDWAATVDGYIQCETDVHMLRQQINARIQTLPNEVDGFDGIDYLNIIFGNTTWAVKAQALIDVIKEIPSVNNVLYVASSWVDKIGGEFKITFAIDSIFGKLDFAIGIDQQNKTLNLN